MLFNVLIASLIPFVIWVIQKITGNTGPKASYLRRKIFAYGILIIFIFSVIGFISLFQEAQGNEKSIEILTRVLARDSVFWAILLWAGLSNKPNEDKGFLYSIWQPYKAEYIADKKKISKSQKKIIQNKEPEFLSDETKEGWLIDQKNIWCKRFYLEKNPNADLKQYVVEQTGKLLPNQPPEITKELKLKIKEAKSDWKYYLNNGWLPTDKKWD